MKFVIVGLSCKHKKHVDSRIAEAISVGSRTGCSMCSKTVTVTSLGSK